MMKKVLLAVAALAEMGVLMAVGAAGLAWTNTEAFCIGCHEMESTVYAEFQDTIHDHNRTGVRAVCADCHVPREPWPMIQPMTYCKNWLPKRARLTQRRLVG